MPLLWLLILLSRAEAETDQQKLWTLAVSGIMAERWHGRHDELGILSFTEDNKQRARKTLAMSWGAHSKEDLWRVVEELKDGGHNSRFLKEAKCPECGPPMTPQRLEIVRRYGKRFGSTGIAAWDLVRASYVVRFGFLAGYLTESEAWAALKPISRRIQLSFRSWRELQWNYLVGRHYWAPEQVVVNGFSDWVYRKMLTDPGSPWRTLPWNLDLGQKPPPASRETVGTLTIYVRPTALAFEIWIVDRKMTRSLVADMEQIFGCPVRVLKETQVNRDIALQGECVKKTAQGLMTEYHLNLEGLWPRLKEFDVSQLLVLISQTPGGELHVFPEAWRVYEAEGGMHASMYSKRRINCRGSRSSTGFRDRMYLTPHYSPLA